MNKKTKLVRAVALILLFSIISLPIITLFVRADPGWLAGWDKRVKITLDSGDVDAALTNFPDLIHLSASCGENNEDITFVFDEIGANWKKIAVTSSDGETQLYVEKEKWDLGNEEAWLWTKVPSVASGTDTEIYLYFDNDHADNDAFVGAINSAPAENVWDEYFELVLHLNETGGDATTRYDSTDHDNDFTAVDITTPDAEGKIDGADDFVQANTDYHEKITNNFNLQIFSVEAWANPDLSGDVNTITRLTLATGARGWEFRMHTDKKLIMYGRDDAGQVTWTVTSVANLEVDRWHYVAGTCAGDGNTAYGYINGTQDGSGAVTTIDYGDTIVRVGASPQDLHWFDGTIDEFRISNIVRTPVWIKASYESGRDHLNDFGSEETLVTVTDTDTYTTTSCTSTTTTTCDTTSTIYTDYTTTTDTISITTTTSLSSTTTCISSCITTTVMTSEITTTTVVHTVVYDACVLDEFDDDTLVAWYNNTHRHDSIVDILHEPVLDAPDGILTLVGTLDSGNLASVQTFDDADSYNVSEVTGAPGYDIRFNFTGLTDTYTNVNCSFYLWYDGGAGHTVEMQTWNYTSGAWIICGVITEAADFGWFNFSRMGAGGDIVRGGILRGRIVHTSPGNINHDIFIDYIELRLDICPCGQVYSENMLEDLNATQIVYFRYNITITPYREAFSRVRFSQDNTTWVDSDGIAQWENMVTGDNSILLTGLGWEGNFFYRVWMHKDVNGTSPTLDLAQVCYSTIPAGAGGWNFIIVVALVFALMGIGMMGLVKRR